MELGGDHSRDMRHLDGVLEHVLAVARAVIEAPEKEEDLLRKVQYARLIGGFLARLSYVIVELRFRFLHFLLYFRGLYAPVLQELLERYFRELAPQGIEGRKNYGLRRVVHDDLYARKPLERADIPPLPADDLSLQFLVGDRHHGRRHVRNGIPRIALEGRRDDLQGLRFQLLHLVALQLDELLHELLAGHRFHLRKHPGLRLFLRKTRDALQFLHRLFLRGHQILFLYLQALQFFLLPLGQGLRIRLAALHDRLFLQQMVLQAPELRLPLALVLLRVGKRPRRLVLRGNDYFLRFRLCGDNQPLRFGFSAFLSLRY